MRWYILCFFLFCLLEGFTQELSLIAPDNQTITSDSVLSFTWNHDINSNYYQLQISQDSTFTSIQSDYQNITTSTLTIDSFYTPNLYYWRIRSYDGTIYSNWSNERWFRVFNPNVSPCIALWLGADSGIVFESGKIKEWHDISPNQNHMTQTDTLLQPQWTDSVLNNKPAVTFSTALDYMNFTDTIDTLGVTLFTVLKNTRIDGSSFLGSLQYFFAPGLFVHPNHSTFRFKGNRDINVNYPYHFNFSLITMKYDTAQYGDYWQSYYATIKHNQILSDSLSMYGYHFSLNWIGTTDYYGSQEPCEGYLLEVIIYYSPLNDSIINIVEQYLRYKYAPPVNLGYDIYIPYGFCDTVISANSVFFNYIWNSGNINDTLPYLTVNKSGLYSVTVTDIFGFESSDAIMVYYNIPNQISDTTICFGDTIYWNTNLNHDYNFLWSTGSNDSLIAIYEAGDYYVQVSDSLDNCFFYTDTITVIIDSFPINATLGPDTELCSGNSITLQTGFAETFLWSTGDTTEFITIDTAGEYSVIVEDYLGCSKSDTISVTIKGLAPIPGFINSTTCYGDSTHFTDVSYTNDGSNIISWNWDFGDLTGSILQYPVKIFNNTGLYTISLTIETDSGCFNTIIDTIRVYPLPVAGFYQNGFCENTNIQFFDTSNCSSGTIISWDWNFGNSQSAMIQNPITQYINEGDYVVNLVIYSNIGCTDSIDKNISILNSPTAYFSYSKACSNAPMYFYDQSDVNIINTVSQWNWDFGNGLQSIDQNPECIYPDYGLDTVSLVIRSLNGCTDSISETIYINPGPVAYFTDSVSCNKNIYIFSDESTIDAGNIISHNWLINDEITLAGTNPEYLFNISGQYSIKLEVISDSLCNDSVIRNFTVYDLPDADFSYNPYYGIILHPIQFTSVNSDNSFSWDFGDGFTSEELSPVHTYLDSGLFTIIHYSIDENGCKDSLSMQISVLIPDCDILVVNVASNINNNYMSVCADIANFGNIPVTNLELYVHLNNESMIKENWTGLLLAGSVFNYCFTGKYKIDPEFPPEFLCVTAYPTEYTDINPVNNEFCISDNNDFTFFDPYPNPAQTVLYFSVIIPESGNFLYSVYDKIGKLVEEHSITGISSGYNKFMINLEKYRKGTYSITVEYKDQIKSKQFIVN
ncbi:MAG: PKD domain-containing protein [Bacteroidota bacterium]